MKITIGIPCFGGVSAETLDDYMRLTYHLGRRMPEHDFFVAIKSKSEQFRARNSIVEAALQVGSDYLLFLDDDQAIAWRDAGYEQYDFLRRLLAHQKPIVGALYYHRGGECLPVVMKEGKNGGFYYMRDDEITGGLQEVAVTGGGAMLIDMKIFDKVRPPWFAPEHDAGTDVQICTAAREAGFSVYCDTSVVLGHVKSSREVVTPHNRHRIIMETSAVPMPEGLDPHMVSQQVLALYQMDAAEYLGINAGDINRLANEYYDGMAGIKNHRDKREYYANLGPSQVARQVWYHHQPPLVQQMEMILSQFRDDRPLKVADFGCGSAPVSFELAMHGHAVDWIDVDGAPAYEFTKWRAQKRNIANCGWAWGGPYDVVLALDSIEHIEDWRSVVDEIAERLRENGVLLTNYFFNEDYANAEHISMDKAAVKKHLVSRGLYPLNDAAWIKRDLGFMDRPKEEVAA